MKTTLSWMSLIMKKNIIRFIYYDRLKFIITTYVITKTRYMLIHFLRNYVDLISDVFYEC